MGLCTKSQGRSFGELPDTCDKYETIIQTECVIHKHSSEKGKHSVICTMEMQTIL